EREISHLKTTYKNLFDSITFNRAHAKLHNLVYENAKLRAQLFKNTWLVHTARTRWPQPKGNTRNARVPSESKSSEVKKNVTVEDHRRILLLSKNQKTMSSECNNIKLSIRNDKSKIIYGTCCSKHMTGNIKLLINFVRMFLGTVCFRNDHIVAILGYVLKEYFDSVGITYETSAAKTPKQNGVIDRINRTLVEAARTMLIFSHAPLFVWAEAIAAPCYTQNRALYYPKNDYEDIGKLSEKGDIGFFIGYSANSIAYRVYNRRTKNIMETMNVMFDELSAMAFE
nr:hypothetical protein [Tanacetum cinerariifolium]